MTIDMHKQLLILSILLCFLPVSAEGDLATDVDSASAESALENDIMGALQVAAEYESDRDYDSALDEYLSLVEVVAQSKGNFSDQLLEPLAGLSRTYIAMGYMEEAELSLRRAQHITHRNDGVYSPRQVEFIEMMVELALKTGEPLDADKQQQFLFFVSSHHFTGLDSIHAYTGLANWYTATGQYRKARKILDEVITLIKTDAGEHDLRLLEPLKLISQNRRLQGACCSEKSLELAIEILNQHDDAPADIIADIYAELADAYTFHRKADVAAGLYATSYAAMNTGVNQPPKMIAMSRKIGATRHSQSQMFRLERDSFGGYSRMRRMSLDEQLEADYQSPQIFTVPLPGNSYGVKIKDSLTMSPTARRTERTETWVGAPYQFIFRQLQNILPVALRDEASVASIFIQLNFTVSETGAVHDIEFTSTNAPVKLNKLMKEVVRKTRFRPGLVEGRPVITHNVTLSQSFEPNQKFPGREV